MHCVRSARAKIVGSDESGKTSSADESASNREQFLIIIQPNHLLHNNHLMKRKQEDGHQRKKKWREREGGREGGRGEVSVCEGGLLLSTRLLKHLHVRDLCATNNQEISIS